MAPIATAVFSLRHRPKAASQFQIGATHRPPHVKNAKAASLLLRRRRLLKKSPFVASGILSLSSREAATKSCLFFEVVFFGEIFLPKIHEVRVKRREGKRGEGQMSFSRGELCFFGRRTKFYDGFKAGSKNERKKRGRLVC